MKFKNLLAPMLMLILIISCAEKEPADVIFKKFKNETNIDNKIKIFDEYKNDHEDVLLGKNMLSNLINQLSDSKNFEKATKLLENNTGLATSQAYNTIAWEMFSGQKDLNKAVELADKGVGLARTELKNAVNTKPDNMSAEEWMNVREASLGFVLDTYGNIIREKGENDRALSAFTEAVKYTKGKYGDINESYVKSLINSKKLDEAQSEIKKFMEDKAYTENMKLLLKDTYVKLDGNEKGYDKYLKEFEKESSTKMLEKLKKEEKNEPAPQFTLNDVNGNKVSLSDFKGKTVVIDFWATWCKPCLNSFSFMNRAVQKYSSDPNVQFLFVNTWERVENKKQNAKDFITSNNYPFRVLLDEQNVVVENFNVQGIPTKFIIDKIGNIRFESIGFDGLEDEALAELSQMIDMVK